MAFLDRQIAFLTPLAVLPLLMPRPGREPKRSAVIVALGATWGGMLVCSLVMMSLVKPTGEMLKLVDRLQELLALPEEQALQKVVPAGTAFASPAGSDTAFVRLTPGRYGVVCFIPEGTRPPAEGSGPPHFTLGMKGELTVT